MSVKVTPGALPFPLQTLIDLKDSGTIPLSFKRKLGEVDAPPVVEKRKQKPANDWYFGQSMTAQVENDFALTNTQFSAKQYFENYSSVSLDVAKCMFFGVSELSVIAKCEQLRFDLFLRHNFEYQSKIESASRTVFCQHNTVRNSFQYKFDQYQPFSNTYALNHDNKHLTSIGLAKSNCFVSLATLSRPYKECKVAQNSPARTIPDQFYPLPIEPTQPSCDCLCGPKPSANKLPIAFNKLSVKHEAGMLPLSFACVRHDYIPILKSYTMINTVSASVNGAVLNVLNASIMTDISGFCWQGRVNLYPDDFAAINMDGRQIGDEAEIKLTINGEAFIFLAEDYSDNREFGKKTYTVTGRSTTAKLTADYAKTRSGTVQADLYARQIADSQLEFLPYTIDNWEIADWLIPGGSYSITDKTPIDTLIDIANAAGGFVYSDPSRPLISLKPRWKIPAWELQNAETTIEIPASIIVSINGQKRVNKCCNSVFVWADHPAGVGADVYRRGSDRSIRASALIHPLYTDTRVHQPAGIAALSDTGIHKIETVKLPWSNDYAIPRAGIGEIWQFNEQNGYWRGVITGVEISAEVGGDGAISVWQTLKVDRYLDN